MKKKILIILIIVIAIISIVILVNTKNQSKTINNVSTESNESSTITYSCQAASTTSDYGSTIPTNKLITKDNLVTSYQVGHNSIYTDSELYNNTLSYLSSQSNQLYINLGNNTIYYYEEINVNDFVNTIALNDNNVNTFITLLKNEGYTCIQES